VALTAIILAGFPSAVLETTRKRLARRYPGYIIRGAAAPSRSNRLCLYDSAEVGKILDQAADSVFGSSKRPVGFCQNSQRGCRKKVADGKCDTSGNRACILLKPERLFLIYQEGEREDDLSRALAHAPLLYRLPQNLYGQSQNAAELCESAIEELIARAKAIEHHLGFGSALLLPPKAFGRDAVVRSMLDRITHGSDPTKELRAFRQNFYDKASHQFVGRSRLGFKPGNIAGLHGIPHDTDDVGIALSRRYRLGCHYDGSFHWDVSPMDGSQLNGKYLFQTRDAGDQRPKGRNANVLVDDCLR
jgi:hypothetical protein